jgi:hypothetical protein
MGRSQDDRPGRDRERRMRPLAQPDAAVTAARLIVAARCAAVPWRNRAGVTRELDAGPGEGGGFDWRLSLADIDHDGPFSALPGVDRVFALFDGDVELHFDERVCTATDADAEPLCFPGEAAPRAVLRGGPTRALNLMLARGRCAGAMRRLVLAAGEAPGAAWPGGPGPTPPGAVPLVSHLVVVEGRLDTDGLTARRGEALAFEGVLPDRVRASAPSAVLQTLVLRLLRPTDPEIPR